MACGVRNLISTQVWMDYISIPQVIGCSRDEVASVLADQKAAIQAIPSYVRHAQHFWICAPSGAQHVDTCCECNYDTWHSRGWCRMEEAALNLERLGDGRALLVTQPLGEEPAVSTFDKIDRAWYQTVHKSKLAALITPSTRACSMAHPTHRLICAQEQDAARQFAAHRRVFLLPHESRRSIEGRC